MAISNELSSEIAAAILTEEKTPQELRRLKEILLRVHSTLQNMSNDAHADSKPQGKSSSAAASQVNQQ